MSNWFWTHLFIKKSHNVHFLYNPNANVIGRPNKCGFQKLSKKLTELGQLEKPNFNLNLVSILRLLFRSRVIHQ